MGGELLIRDVKFTSDMILQLLEKMHGDFPENLNFFKEGENLECLDSSSLAIKLDKRFGIDTEKMRLLVHKDTWRQGDIVVLAHHAIAIANTVTGKRPVSETSATTPQNPKKRKAEEPTVSCFLQ